MNIFCLPSIWVKFQVSRWFCNGFHDEEVAAPSHRRACAGTCAFLAVSLVSTKQLCWAPVHAGVCVSQTTLTSAWIFVTQSLQGVHIRSCMRSLFIRVGRWWGGPASLVRVGVSI